MTDRGTAKARKILTDHARVGAGAVQITPCVTGAAREIPRTHCPRRRRIGRGRPASRGNGITHTHRDATDLFFFKKKIVQDGRTHNKHSTRTITHASTHIRVHYTV